MEEARLFHWTDEAITFLRDFMKENGLKNVDVAYDCGIMEPTISRLLNLEKHPKYIKRNCYNSLCRVCPKLSDKLRPVGRFVRAPRKIRCGGGVSQNGIFNNVGTQTLIQEESENDMRRVLGDIVFEVMDLELSDAQIDSYTIKKVCEIIGRIRNTALGVPPPRHPVPAEPQDAKEDS